MADKKPHPFIDEFADRLGVDSVTFLQAVRDVEMDVGTDHPKVTMKDRHRSHPIDIVIAVDDDSLPVADRLGDPLRRRLSSRELVGIVQVGKLRVQEGSSPLDVGDTAVCEHLGDQRGRAQPSCKLPRPLPGVCHFPAA